MRGTQPRGDRCVQRTRDSLRAAFVALMAERGWDRVSVQDVCDRANVGRSTFYTHFADKEEHRDPVTPAKLEGLVLRLSRPALAAARK